jgi:hypothetical protein
LGLIRCRSVQCKCVVFRFAAMQLACFILSPESGSLGRILVSKFIDRV